MRKVRAIFLHRLDTAAHGLIAPEIQEHAGPGGRVVFPELLKIFFEEIGTDGLEIVAEQIAQTELLLRGEILFALEYAPTRLLQRTASTRSSVRTFLLRICSILIPFSIAKRSAFSRSSSRNGGAKCG